MLMKGLIGGAILFFVALIVSIIIFGRPEKVEPPETVEEITVKMTNPEHGATVQEVSKDVPITLKFSAKIKPKEVEILVEREGVEAKGTKASGLTENEIVWTPKKENLEDGNYTVTVAGKKFDSPLVGTTFSFTVKAKVEPVQPPVQPPTAGITDQELTKKTDDALTAVQKAHEEVAK